MKFNPSFEFQKHFDLRAAAFFAKFCCIPAIFVCSLVFVCVY